MSHMILTYRKSKPKIAPFLSLHVEYFINYSNNNVNNNDIVIRIIVYVLFLSLKAQLSILKLIITKLQARNQLFQISNHFFIIDFHW